MAEFYISFDGTDHWVRDIPVRIDIFDRQMVVVESAWMQLGGGRTAALPPGTYGLRATLPSGKVFEAVAQLAEGDDFTPVRFDMRGISPKDTQNWAYFSQRSMQAPASDNYLKEDKYDGAWLRLWRLQEDDLWLLHELPYLSDSSWDGHGVTYAFEAPSGTSLLQVGGPQIPWKFIGLPPGQKVRVLIRPATGKAAHVHPLDVTATTGNLKAAGLLTLMQRGDLESASQLQNPARIAELLLMGKMRNTDGAIVGGYYLLKMRELDRLHDWANNLANWFPRQADGSVIHGWQILLQNPQPSEEWQTAKERLLEAVERGLPMYTEGLKRLHKGLQVLDNFGNDLAVAEALRKIERYMLAADLSAVTTTFTGAHPSEPDVAPGMGMPARDTGLAYIFNVPVEVLEKEMAKLKAEAKPSEELNPRSVEISKEDVPGVPIQPETFRQLRDDLNVNFDLDDERFVTEAALPDLRSKAELMRRAIQRARTGKR